MTDDPHDPPGPGLPECDLPECDLPGFDVLGFDVLGFDVLGFDILGFDVSGFDTARSRRHAYGAAAWNRTTSRRSSGTSVG